MNAGAMARLVPTMLPTITPSPRWRAASAISSASVRPPHLSSLILTTSKRPTSPGTSSTPRAFGHDLGLVGAQREGGDQRPRFTDACEVARPDTAALRLQLPHRAVDCVARSAARHALAQLLAARACFDRLAVRFELRDDVG